MKAKRLLGILLAVMMVAVCGCAKPEEKPVVDDAPKYTVRDGFVTDLEDILTVEYTNNETTISMELLDGAWFKKGDQETWINQTIIMNVVKTAGQMAYIEEIKEFTSLADYGLEKPVYTITMENEDGFVVSLYIGNAEGEEECYVTTGDKDVVYKVSNAIIGMLEFDEEKLIAVEVDPMQYLKDSEVDGVEGDGLTVEDTTVTDGTIAEENPDEDVPTEDPTTEDTTTESENNTEE